MPSAKKYALLIGNDRYADFAELKAPAADVEGLRRVLADPAIGGFEVEVLMNPNLGDAQEAIGELFAERVRDDLTLLYFSGHGEKDGIRGALYLALADSRRDRLRATAVPTDFVKTEMEESRAGRQILILDCCFAGAIGGKGGGAVDAEAFGGIAEAKPAATPEGGEDGYGRVTLASSTATQTSWEGNRVIEGVERSLFTHFLIRGLETGEAAEGRPRVSVGQLYRYAHREVAKATAGVGAKRMTPQCWVHRQEGELIVARNPHPPAPRPEDLLPEDLLADLASANPRTRLGAVHSLAGLKKQPALEKAICEVLEERLRPEGERDYEVRELIAEVLKVGASGMAGRSQTEPTHAATRDGAGQTPSPVPGNPAPEPPLGRSRPEPLTTFRDTLRDSSKGPEMVVIPHGQFWMGSPEDEPERTSLHPAEIERLGRLVVAAIPYVSPACSNEERHQVEIERAFAIAKYQTTFDQYDRFARATGRELPDDCGWGREDRPVIHVSWDDAMAYAAWLAEQTGKGYRLPTEAEWEYAARAGTTTPFYTGDCISTDQANYDGNWGYSSGRRPLGIFPRGDCGAKTGLYRQKTVPVGSLPPNPWGLHEMAGNVWEWTCSAYADYGEGQEGQCVGKNDANKWPLRASRGGSWDLRPRWLRAATRNGGAPSARDDDRGFRLAQDL